MGKHFESFISKQVIVGRQNHIHLSLTISLYSHPSLSWGPTTETFKPASRYLLTYHPCVIAKTWHAWSANEWEPVVPKSLRHRCLPATRGVAPFVNMRVDVRRACQCPAYSDVGDEQKFRSMSVNVAQRLRKLDFHPEIPTWFHRFYPSWILFHPTLSFKRKWLLNPRRKKKWAVPFSWKPLRLWS